MDAVVKAGSALYVAILAGRWVRFRSPELVLSLEDTDGWQKEA